MRTKGRKIEVVVTDKVPEGFVDDSEKWENGELGQSEEHAKPASRKASDAIENALGLMPISVRLQKSLIEDLKVMAKKEGLGYQAYLRQVLTRHVAAYNK